MPHLADSDLRALVAFALALPGPDDARSFTTAVLEPLRDLVGCDSVTCRWSGDQRQAGVEFQLAVSVDLEPGLVIGLAFNRRARAFTVRDRELLDLARPMLSVCYRAARQCARQREVIEAFETALDRHGEGVIVCGPDGRVRASTTSADRVLIRFFGSSVVVGQPLPSPLASMLGAPAGTRRQLVGAVSGACLLLRHLIQDGQHLLVLHSASTVAAALETSRDLSMREREILDLLATGRASGDIASVLGISRRTVDKHVEHIRTKLDVPTRTAAVARWLNT